MTKAIKKEKVYWGLIVSDSKSMTIVMVGIMVAEKHGIEAIAENLHLETQQ